jgi:TRAP-type transport system periplasmic protein
MAMRFKSTAAIFLLVCTFTLTMAMVPQAQAETTLKFNHVFAPGAPADRAAHFFAENVEKKTNGEIKVQIFPSSQLGNVLGTFQGLTLGTIDATVIDVNMAGYIKGHEAFFIGQVPYLFKSLNDAERIYNSDLFKPLFDKLREDKGVRMIAVSGHKQGRCINTTKGPIFSPADCKGIKIRVMPIPVCIKSFETWGFKSTPVNWSELYMALKQGIVDGQDNGPDLTCPQKFYEVAKYFAITNHVYASFGWYLSEKTWKKIPAQYHELLQDEAKNAGQMLTDYSKIQWQNCVDTMLQSGVKITYPDRFAFADAVKDVYKEFDGSLWPQGMVEKIKSMQN